jgi:hypothetical protein
VNVSHNLVGRHPNPLSALPRRRSRLLVGLGALALAAAGVSGVGQSATPAEAASGTARPTLTFTNPATPG